MSLIRTNLCSTHAACDRLTRQVHKAKQCLSIGVWLATPLTIVAVLTPAQAVEPEPGYLFDPGQQKPEYYIGVDGRTTLTFGSYAGLDNPNLGRLTFLFAHREEDPLDNHFHGIGTYSYTGAVANPTIVSTNQNNRIPETYTGLPPLGLQPGSGIYQDRFISVPSAEEYSNLLMQPVAVIGQSSDLGEQTLFNSSNQGWNQSLGDASIALQLVDITDGLNIANGNGVNILETVGDRYIFGQGDDFAFLPTFWVEKTAPKQNYSATFKLVDTTNSLGDSGTFSIDFRPVPEPSILLGLSAVGMMSLGRVRARRISVERSIR